MKTIDVVHITVVRKLTSGHIRQLSAEYEAARKICDVNWKVVSLDNSEPILPFMYKIPKIFRVLFLRNLYGWIVALRFSKENDIILLRHMAFDPFAFVFAPFIPNRISVHHSKEVGELILVRPGWRGKLAAALESRSGVFTLRRAVAVAGVTREIACYENRRAGTSKPVLVYPNGINTDSVDILEDRRETGSINVVLMCGVFSEWHGLDKLMRAVVDETKQALCGSIRIHLIGNLTKNQIDAIKQDRVMRHVFVIHGHLTEQEYRPILALCDSGLTSFALERQGLTEASTLKVREMLAMGLPVYSGHIDAALGDDCDFFLHDEHVCISRMIDFSNRMKQMTREDVSQKAKPFIEKKVIMEEAVEFFRTHLMNLS